jgi:chromodomain-helicase-DNA-binding protein 3
MSILPDVCRPLLIVSTPTSLALWEAKFNRLAPSINVVVYNGEKDVRKTIQDLEFYEKGSVMFQVLLSHPDAIVEVIVFCYSQLM